MKDSERISNLEEMLAEILMRLDRVDAELVRLRKGQSQAIGGMDSMTSRIDSMTGRMDSMTGRMDSMEETMRELAKYMFELNDRQTMVEHTMRDISTTNRIMLEKMDRMATKDDLEAMATKDDLVKLFDFVVDRFNTTDTRLDGIDKRLENLGKQNDNDQPDSSQS